jgi:hypothetical protein
MKYISMINIKDDEFEVAVPLMTKKSGSSGELAFRNMTSAK